MTGSSRHDLRNHIREVSMVGRPLIVLRSRGRSRSRPFIRINSTFVSRTLVLERTVLAAHEFVEGCDLRGIQ